MRFVLLHSHQGITQSVSVVAVAVAITTAAILVATISFITGYFIHRSSQDVEQFLPAPAYMALKKTKSLVEQPPMVTAEDVGQQQLQRSLNSLVVKLANIEARVTRLDALGARVAQKAKLSNGEFDFKSAVPLGGPEEDLDGHGDIENASYESVSETIDSISSRLDEISTTIDSKGERLTALDQMLKHSPFVGDAFQVVQPTKSGWLSSNYGHRIDPFTRRMAWHKGIDFAATAGSPVIAAAAGVVIFSGYKKGYGNLVEISHGSGYSTRYGHSRLNLVRKGQLIQKGQAIAQVGSTGRSTGPHVHFEVLKDNKQVNPRQYLNIATTYANAR
ncbi:MAG: M23 family metallopeptidase [Pseudomonadota bacterium]